MRHRFFPYVVATHATYIFLTAVWPLVDIETFMDITGPKQDVWLVKTVGALLIPVAVTLYSYLFIDNDTTPAVILGALTATAFIAIDFYYALNEVISDIYMLDGAVEIIFLIAWLVVAFSKRNPRSGH